MRRFQRLYAGRLHELGVVVPAVVDELVSSRVLVTHWVDGTPQRRLTPSPKPQAPSPKPQAPDPKPQTPDPGQARRRDSSSRVQGESSRARRCDAWPCS